MKGIIASILLPISGLIYSPKIFVESSSFQNVFLFSKAEVVQTNQEGIKKTYHTKRKKIAFKGKEINGEKVGVWEFFNEEGKVYLKYNYSTQEEVFYSKNSMLPHLPDLKIFVIQNGVEVEQTPDRFPVPIPPKKGSFNKSVKIYYDPYINYPSEARKQVNDRTVKVSFLIDEKGNSKDFKVEERIGGGWDEEALLKAIELTTLNLPALMNGKPVAVKCIWPVKFGLF